jgi:hypothetical protein
MNDWSRSSLWLLSGDDGLDFEGENHIKYVERVVIDDELKEDDRRQAINHAC